jgi:hypothetical protein
LINTAQWLAHQVSTPVPTYADVYAVIPGFQILALISAVVAVLFLVTAVVGQWRISILGTCADGG